MVPSVVHVSVRIVGETKKSYKLSRVFIGTFHNGARLVTRVSKPELIEKSDFSALYSGLIIGETRSGFPLLCDQLSDRLGNPLYDRDWSQLETYPIM